MKEMQKFEKGLNKLRKRGAVGLGIFVGNTNANSDDIAKEALMFISQMKKNKTRRIV